MLDDGFDVVFVGVEPRRSRRLKRSDDVLLLDGDEVAEEPGVELAHGGELLFPAVETELVCVPVLDGIPLLAHGGELLPADVDVGDELDGMPLLAHGGGELLLAVEVDVEFDEVPIPPLLAQGGELLLGVPDEPDVEFDEDCEPADAIAAA